MGRLKIERSTVQYYLNRMNSLSSIKNPEERHTFVLNTYLSFQKDTWKVALSPQVCRCLEELLNHASVDSVTVALKTLSKSWDEVINSKFAYHLLHKALIKCLTTEYHADELISSYVESFCTHMKANLSTYVKQPHTTHTCRIYPQILAGVLLEKDNTSNTYKSTTTQLFTPYDEDYAQTLTKLCEEYLFTEALKDHVTHEFLCPFTQVLLLIASVRLPEVLKKNFKKLMKFTGLYSTADAGEKSVAETKYPNAYSHPIAVYFSELLIGVMPGSHFADFLNNRILTESTSPTGDNGVVNTETFANLLMSHPTGSCVLRSVIRRLAKLADIKHFLAVIQSCESTESGLRGALSNGQYNVLTELADLCSRQSSDKIQRIFLQMLPPVFGFAKKHNSSTVKEDLFICCLVGMLPVNALNKHIQNHSAKEEVNEKDAENNAKAASGKEENAEKEGYVYPVTLSGCLFVQTLLKFTQSPPIRVVSSLLSLSSKRLIAWAQHPQLSRVLEAVLTSVSVTIERKVELFKTLTDGFCILACHPSGSHVIEALWTATNDFGQPMVYKKLMAEQLTSKQAGHLDSHRYGHFVYKKLSLELYKTNKNLWLSRNSPDRLLKKRANSEKPQQISGAKRARGEFK